MIYSIYGETDRENDEIEQDTTERECGRKTHNKQAVEWSRFQYLIQHLISHP